MNSKEPQFNNDADNTSLLGFMLYARRQRVTLSFSCFINVTSNCALV